MAHALTVSTFRNDAVLSLAPGSGLTLPAGALPHTLGSGVANGGIIGAGALLLSRGHTGRQRAR